MSPERFVKGVIRTLMCFHPYIFHRDGAPVGDFKKSWTTATKAAKCEELLFHDFRLELPEALCFVSRIGCGGQI
jgi:hypothetical protein